MKTKLINATRHSAETMRKGVTFRSYTGVGSFSMPETPMKGQWTDEAFLGYVDIHCETDLALFHRNHVNRLLRLAGRSELQDPHTPLFLHVYADVAKPLIEAAKERMSDG
jgi:hypothetical protein